MYPTTQIKNILILLAIFYSKSCESHINYNIRPTIFELKNQYNEYYNQNQYTNSKNIYNLYYNSNYIELYYNFYDDFGKMTFHI